MNTIVLQIQRQIAGTVNTNSSSVVYSTLVSIKANLVLGEITEEIGSITGTTGVTGSNQ